MRDRMVLGMVGWMFVSLTACGPQQSGASSVDQGLSSTWYLRANPQAARLASIQAAADRSYRFELATRSGALVARVASQGLRAELAAGVLHIESEHAVLREDGGWQLALRWRGVGRSGSVRPVAAPGPQAAVVDNLVSYRYPDGAQQYFVNGPLGVEQGFVLTERPTGDGELVLEIEVDGGLRPRLASKGTMVLLETAARAPALRYGALYAEDGQGRELSTALTVEQDRIVLQIDDRDASYPLHVDPLVAVQTQRLIPSGELQVEVAFFGASVALSGDIALVGETHFVSALGTHAGRVHIFEREQNDSSVWSAVKTHLLDDPSSTSFGHAVALSGDTAVVGQREGETAHVLERDLGGAGNWGVAKVLAASEAEEDLRFLEAAAISGDTIVMGAATPNYGTHLLVFERDADGPDGWGLVETHQTSADSTWPLFGASLSVALSGDTLVAGVLPFEEDDFAVVFQRDQGDAGGWVEVQRLQPSPAGYPGSFGQAVAVSGDTVVVGGESTADVYLRDEGGPDSWGWVQRLEPSDEGPPVFGGALAIDGGRLVVGARPFGSEAAYIFERSDGEGSSWIELIRVESPTGLFDDDQFAAAVAIEGSTLLVGAPYDLAQDGIRAGVVYVYDVGSADADPCTTGAECVSGHCVDGVCCDTECGVGEPDDCLACSVAAGAEEDGRCGLLADGTTCDRGECLRGLCESFEAGLPCTSDVQCATDHCVDEVCCREPECWPYLCRAGTGECGAPCRSASECVEGFRCTSDGVCEPEPSGPAPDDGGCGCRAVTSRHHIGAWAAALVCLGLLTRRRQGRHRDTAC